MVKEMTPGERRRLQKSAPSLFREPDQTKIDNFLAKQRALDITMTGKAGYITALRQVGATDEYIKEEKTRMAEMVGFRTDLGTSSKINSQISKV